MRPGEPLLGPRELWLPIGAKGLIGEMQTLANQELARREVVGSNRGAGKGFSLTKSPLKCAYASSCGYCFQYRTKHTETYVKLVTNFQT